MIAPQALKLKTKFGATVLMVAVWSKNYAMIQEVLECMQTNISDTKQVRLFELDICFELRATRGVHVCVRLFCNHSLTDRDKFEIIEFRRKLRKGRNECFHTDSSKRVLF